MYSLWSWDVRYSRCELKLLHLEQVADRQTLGSIANWFTAKLGYKPTYYHIRISNSFKRRCLASILAEHT